MQNQRSIGAVEKDRVTLGTNRESAVVFQDLHRKMFISRCELQALSAGMASLEHTLHGTIAIALRQRPCKMIGSILSLGRTALDPPKLPVGPLIPNQPTNLGW